ncbi:AgmX/PglI C-terminal domain-containing protein [Lujinxingia vulgaris]|nr:AgmX/PglI C-terminal domain-containing protein [Lujinxingia vulgaris]
MSTSSSGCGPLVVILIAIFCGTLGVMTGAGGLYLYLSQSADGLERLNLASASTDAQPAPPSSSGSDDVYAMAYPITDTLQFQGKIDEGSVRTRITNERSAFQRCYQRVLDKTPDVRGELSLQFTVSGSTGEVIAAVTRDNYTNSEALADCVTGELKKWRFPAPETSQISVVRFEALFLPFRAEQG